MTAARTTSLLAAGLLAAPLSTAVPLSTAATPATAAAPAYRTAGCTRVPSDFNGDGYADLAAGSPGTTLAADPTRTIGAVSVLFGSAAGMGRGAAAQHLTPESPGMPGQGEDLEPLGHVTASGYFDDDCYADLAVVGNYEQYVVLYGSAAGLGTARARLFDRESIPGGQTRKGIGRALATGDFNDDGRDDLAVGAWGQDWDNGGTEPVYDDGGAVGILNGSATGLTTDGAYWITQDTPGVPGTAENYDGFGATLATADFDGDGRTDLAVAAPRETIGGVPRVGGVVVLRGAAGGLSGAGARWFDQDTAGVPGSNEDSDHFGLALAAGDITGDGRAELAIGAQWEAAGTVPWAGAVTVLRGGAGGVSATGAARWDQNDPRIPGAAEADDLFGASLAIADLDRDGVGDLAIGAPWERVGAYQRTGAVTIVRGSTDLSAAGSRFVDQNSPGVPGTNEYEDEFGTALHTVSGAYGGEDALVVGARLEKSGPAAAAYHGAFSILPSGPSGLPGPTGYFFGPGQLPAPGLIISRLGEAFA